MKVIIFGGTGMVGRGALRECLLAPEVTSVLSVTRRPSNEPAHAKLTELVHADFTDFSSVASKMQGYDACFWALGVTSSGMTEEEYTKVTHGYTMAAAKAMIHPGMTFVFVSGEGSDSTGTSSLMWARVKGKAENDILAMPFKAAFVFRPGIIRPMHGIESQTKSYRIMYKVLGPIIPLIKACAPNSVTSTEAIGRAMLQCVHAGAPNPISSNGDINALADAYLKAKA